MTTVIVLVVILALVLVPAAVFDRRRRRQGRSVGGHAEARRVGILTDTATVESEAMNRPRRSDGGGGGF